MIRIAYAVLVLCTTAAVSVPAQTLTTLHRFDGADGANPAAALVQATDGDLYGTTLGGGANAKGTIFKITTSGKLTVLYSFCAQSQCTDGDGPSGLVQATNGDFYGTTSGAGANGGGTVFKITRSGTLSTLYAFCAESACADGRSPQAALIQATNGDLFGTTFGYDGAGATVFKITPSGILTTLYTFCAQGGTCEDGQAPVGALVQVSDEDFYGTTTQGGTDGGYGTVFKITASGALTMLFSFDGTDGSGPGSLVQATTGEFYGTTSGGGANDGSGTVFKITPGGTLTTLYSFCSLNGCSDGYAPFGGLTQGTDGNFYGTTGEGGSIHNQGTVFEIAASGTLTTLYTFCSQSPCTGGSEPIAGLVQSTNGDFYGSTSASGIRGGDGAIFSLSVGLGPFVKTQPISGKIGSAVKILGTDLTGAASVTFNGAAAVFEALSSSEIKATVPAGATTGKVQVVTPGGTLSSNVSFRVP